MRKLISKLLGKSPEGSSPPAPPEPELREWPQNIEIMPWLDHDDAPDQLKAKHEQKEISEEQFAQGEKWIKDGYLHLEGMISPDLVDSFNRDCDALWESDAKPVEGLEFKTIVINEQDEVIPSISHADLLKMPEKQRFFARDRGLWRVHGLHYLNDHANQIFNHSKLKETVSFLLGQETNPTFSINFRKGSEQHVHQDLMVFHIHPPGFLIGVWIALEDIDPGSGPLHYWPGSHREKFFDRFSNYPQTNARTANPEDKAAYEKHLDGVAKKYEDVEFLPKKGDALLWHGMLLHSGSPVKDPTKTRRSFVIHFIPEGMDKTNEMVGPFNW